MYQNETRPEREAVDSSARPRRFQCLLAGIARFFFPSGSPPPAAGTPSEELADSDRENSPPTDNSRQQGNLHPRPENVDLPDVHHLIAELATGVWRMRGRLERSEHSQQPDELRRLGRHVERLCDVLAERHVEVRDQTGERYVPGMALKILSYQPTSGIRHEKISETIKPTVFFHDTLIQPGEVIVATPEAPTDEPPSDETDSTPKDQQDTPAPATKDEETGHGTLDN